MRTKSRAGAERTGQVDIKHTLESLNLEFHIPHENARTIDKRIDLIETRSEFINFLIRSHIQNGEIGSRNRA
ncbi:hypothetical protein D3C80_2002910 [compost metagenome]